MMVLECKNLSVGYDSKEVAKQINFTVENGNYLFIVGENGSGKSTLMKTILGLIKPLDGIISFGKDIKQTEIGYIPQQTDTQKDFPASVYEIVLSGCLSQCGIKPFYSHKQKEEAKKYMHLFNIDSLSKKCYRELSGGQQQRVLLARALCAAKKILLMDEPVAGLDPIVTQELYEIIDDLNKTQKMTIIMISHDITAALKYASHILTIGSPCFFGNVNEFKNSTFCKKTFEEI